MRQTAMRPDSVVCSEVAAAGKNYGDGPEMGRGVGCGFRGGRRVACGFCKVGRGVACGFCKVGRGVAQRPGGRNRAETGLVV
ncbi:hypothetical protein GCM10009741_42560 [Kribbella lupini]|uniref:Uncharacterized protein n=1 Tax=Kribbella lupini TaxID=291602 RepID=A0ABP4M2V4_9ACTN